MEKIIIYIEESIASIVHFTTNYFPYSLIAVLVVLVVLFYVWRIISLWGLYMKAINPFKGRFAKIVKVVDGDTIVVGSIKNKKKTNKNKAYWC